MTDKTPLQVDLKKWPALLVSGKAVTREQAIDINFRTGSLYGTNDKDFESFVAQTMGLEEYEFGGVRFSDEDNQRLGRLELEYLGNHNVMSCYIGGPHGWCSWDGAIFANSYNIGKWPSVTEVQDEWERIAAAFPYLDLTCQLLDMESGEEGGSDKALVEFRVKDGKVEVYIPENDTPMVASTGPDFSSFARNFNNPYREHVTEREFVSYWNSFKEIRGL